MKKYHVSGRGARSIDIIFNNDRNMIEIIDSYDKTKKMNICKEDWNELIKKIREHKIGFL